MVRVFVDLVGARCGTAASLDKADTERPKFPPDDGPPRASEEANAGGASS